MSHGREMQVDWKYEDEWFEEGNISLLIKTFLERNGYKILRFNQDKRERGHDIEAAKGKELIVVECKGYPSDRYVDGPKKGQKKPTNPKLQSMHWFSDALFHLVIAKSENPKTTIALGLPDKPKYHEYLGKIAYFKEQFGLVCYFVNEDKRVWVE